MDGDAVSEAFSFSFGKRKIGRFTTLGSATGGAGSGKPAFADGSVDNALPDLDAGAHFPKMDPGNQFDKWSPNSDASNQFYKESPNTGGSNQFYKESPNTDSSSQFIKGEGSVGENDGGITSG